MSFLSFFFVDDGVGVGVALRDADADGDGVAVALGVADAPADAVALVLGLADGLALALALMLGEAEATSVGAAEAVAAGVRGLPSGECPLPGSCAFSGVRVRLGLAVADAEGDEVASTGFSPRDFDGRSLRLPRSLSDFSLRSRDAEADADAVGPGAGAVSMTGAAAGTSATTRLRAIVNPSLCALSSSAVVLTAAGALSAVS